MWKKIHLLLSEKTVSAPSPGETEERIRAAAAVLMIQAALADGVFCDEERRKVSQAIRELFDLDLPETETLLSEAENQAREAIDVFSQTRLLTHGLEEEERLRIVEALWKVIDADGVVHDYEAALMRKVAGLLGLDDRDVALARKRVRDL